MKKIVVTLITSIALTFGSLAIADENTVLMFVRDGARDLPLALEGEVLLMKNMLEKEGYEVVIATADGKDLEAGGVSVAVDHKIADL